MTAWDGSAREFWDAVAKHRAEHEIESDAAVLSEVLGLATHEAGRRLLKCTCGSGGHPRDCVVHPQGKELHALEISYDGLKDSVSALAETAREVVMRMEDDAPRHYLIAAITRLRVALESFERQGS